MGLAACVAQSASAAPGETPQAFVRRVYANYKTSDNSTGVDRTRPAGSAFYAAPLLDAFTKDETLLHGTIGVIDSDPLCSCQAWEDLRVKSATFAPGEAQTMKAHLAIANFVAAQRKVVNIVLTLTRTPAGWRIADVGNKDQPSIMAAVRGEIRELTHRPVAARTAPKP